MPFHKVPGAHAVIRSKRTYRQHDVYTFRGTYYAKKGGGFVALYKKGTSDADDTLVEFYVGPENKLFIGALGRLYSSDRESRDCAHRVLVKTGIIENVS